LQRIDFAELIVRKVFRGTLSCGRRARFSECELQSISDDQASREHFELGRRITSRIVARAMR
jgi:hypothetical protein